MWWPDRPEETLQAENWREGLAEKEIVNRLRDRNWTKFPRFDLSRKLKRRVIPNFREKEKPRSTYKSKGPPGPALVV